MLIGCVVFFAQFLVSGVFVISGTTKLREVPGVSATIQRLVPMPSGLARGLAWLSLLAELLTAGLVWYAGGRIGLALAALLFVALAAVAFRAAALPVPIPCRCFGRAKGALGRPHGMRNLVLAGIAVAGLLSSSAGGPSPSLGGIALATTVAVAGILVTVFFDDLAELAHP